ncbi:hypothetical protein DFH69_001196 [Clostridium beijerinckii]|nr:hypothetical protein [Clostridium beijerinckii]NRW84167.1 hypothetical protein [Clostridium beijerinckii]
MKTELEKCMAGENYNCHDEIFLGLKRQQEDYFQNIIVLAMRRRTKKEEF